MDRADNISSGDRVLCRRLATLRTVEEHLGCPYCFGKRAEVEAGDRSEFCDYQPGVDPVTFGFPENSGRLANG
jgi:hypothetical protein